MDKLALAMFVVPIVIGVAIAGFLETEGLSTPKGTATCGPDQGCAATAISSSTLTLGSSSSQSVSQAECPASPGQTGNSSYTVTEAGWPGCDCASVASNSQGMLYVSTNAEVGDLVCLAASLNDSDTVAFTITNSTGSMVLQTAYCVSSGGPPGMPSSTGISCESDWDTAAPGESGGVVTVGTGAVTAGTYTLAATDVTGSPAVLEANFTLGPSMANPSVSSSSASSFEALKTNVTVSYDAECLVLENIGHTCPTVSRGETGSSESPMRGAELIAFQGTDYYAGNFSAGFAGPDVSHDVWFTNSTIFCVSPVLGNYSTCPLSEPLPSVSW